MQFCVRIVSRTEQENVYFICLDATLLVGQRSNIFLQLFENSVVVLTIDYWSSLSVIAMLS